MDYSEAGRFQKLYEKYTPLWQANCPLKREFFKLNLPGSESF